MVNPLIAALGIGDPESFIGSAAPAEWYPHRLEEIAVGDGVLPTFGTIGGCRQTIKTTVKVVKDLMTG